MKTKVKHLQVKLSPTGKVSVRMSRFVNSFFYKTVNIFFYKTAMVYFAEDNERLFNVQPLYNLMVAVLERPFTISGKHGQQQYIRLQLTRAEALAVTIAIAHSPSAYMIELKAEILKALAR